MKQIVITPGSDADAQIIIMTLEGFADYPDYRPAPAFSDALAWCTAVELTDAPANPSGWQSVSTAPDCSAVRNNLESLHLTTP